MNEKERASRLPGEVVETYARRDSREVVEEYRRPLPGQAEAPPPPPRKRSRKGLWIFLALLGVLLALSAGVLVLRWMEEDDLETLPEAQAPAEITIPTWPTGQGAQLPVQWDHGEVLAVQEIYQRVNPAVVAVLAQLEDGMSAGTGVIFSSDGYVVTNHHVVEGASDCVLALSNGRSYEALYVAGDRDNDLAVLKIEAEDLPVAEFGDSDLLTVGDPVYAIGNPLGVELRGTLTDGIVSAIDRDVLVEDGRTMTLLQTNAALNSGNSGGPLINQYGQVVGINVIKMHSRYSTVEGLGFAIPSAWVGRAVNDLLTYGAVQPEPVLGVTVGVNGIEAAPGRIGVQVLEVVADSPAHRAGVAVGDIILQAGGVETLTSRDLLRSRRQYHLGEEMPMLLWRDGREVEVRLCLDQAAE